MLHKEDFYALLDQRHIAYEACEHPAVYTMEEVEAQNIPHREQIVKNLFLRDDKKRSYYLVTLAGHKTVNLKHLGERIPSRKLTFASEDDLWEFLKLEKGHVTPAGILNDAQCRVTMVFDKELEGKRVGIHPLENTATVFLTFEDVKSLVEEHGNPIVLCDLD
ncbi:MAG: prolyl-tRNA synthetase associated domain-containing protein [Candidatus Pelethousia sp.]|nr:prolyl-tRNA synthetase associated domain-containing protein [Candidatus Pelethousia sp.]